MNNFKMMIISEFMECETKEALKAKANEFSNDLKVAYKTMLDLFDRTETVPVEATAKGQKEGAKPAAKKEVTKPAAKKETAKPAPKKEGVKRERKYETEQVALSDTKALKKLGLKFIPYSEKCVVLAGDTKPLAKALAGLRQNGVFANSHLKAVEGFEGGFGWLLNKGNENYKDTCKMLGLKAV